jgi:hypothetical protein
MNDKAAWVDALRRVLTDDAWVAELRGEAGRRVLPRWAQTAEALRAGLER